MASRQIIPAKPWNHTPASPLSGSTNRRTVVYYEEERHKALPLVDTPPVQHRATFCDNCNHRFGPAESRLIQCDGSQVHKPLDGSSVPNCPNQFRFSH